jgi:hypothetical protein
MTGVVDVLVVVDTQMVLGESPNPSQDETNPTTVTDEQSCFLIASPTSAHMGLATKHLHFKHMQVGETSVIHWRSLSLSGNTDRSVVLYGIEIPACDCGERKAKSATAHMRVGLVPLPDLEDGRKSHPPGFTAEEQTDYFLKSPVKKKGHTPVCFWFYITEGDEITGEIKLAGYFRWSGRLTID